MVKTTVKLASLLFCMNVSATNAEISEWKNFENWSISFYPNAKGCSAYTEYEEGTSFWIGFDSSSGELLFEVIIADERWRSIESGKEYNIVASFGDKMPWDMSMIGMDFGEMRGLRLAIDAYSPESGNIANEFMRELDMRWEYDGSLLGFYNLRGSRMAFQETVACQKSFNEAMQSVSGGDPFAVIPPAVEDPFR